MNDQEEDPGNSPNNTPVPQAVVRPETTVYIWNMSEDVWPFIQAISDAKARRHEISENAYLGDRELFAFSSEEHCIFITPSPITPEFFSYFQQVTGRKDITIVVPAKHTGEVCRDIENDKHVMKILKQAGKISKRLMLVGYTTSTQLLHLVDVLRGEGITVFTSEAPEWEDAWTVNFFGSKGGIRQLAQKSSALEPDFKMADGLICSNPEDAAKIAAKKYLKNSGVVVKTNKGHSGAGILIFRPGDLPKTYVECEQAILAKLSDDSYWKMFPIIIEDFVALNSAVGGGCPSIEFRIYKSGQIDFLYMCGMRLTKDGVFHGVEIADDVVPHKLATMMVDTGFFIAEQYREAGYRGYFDVDFIIAKNGSVFVTESNVRRTGGTYVYHLAQRLIGKEFMYQSYILSNTQGALPEGKNFTFPEIMAKVSPVFFDKKTKEGVVITSENILKQHQLSYVIFGKTKKRAIEIEEKMQQLLI